MRATEEWRFVRGDIDYRFWKSRSLRSGDLFWPPSGARSILRLLVTVEHQVACRLPVRTNLRARGLAPGGLFRPRDRPRAAANIGREDLDIWFIDVEGGQSTLIVTPAGESLLIDAGYSPNNRRGGGAKFPGGRDAGRIMAVLEEAGVYGSITCSSPTSTPTTRAAFRCSPRKFRSAPSSTMTIRWGRRSARSPHRNRVQGVRASPGKGQSHHRARRRSAAAQRRRCRHRQCRGNTGPETAARWRPDQQRVQESRRLSRGRHRELPINRRGVHVRQIQILQSRRLERQHAHARRVSEKSDRPRLGVSHLPSRQLRHRRPVALRRVAAARRHHEQRRRSGRPPRRVQDRTMRSPPSMSGNCTDRRTTASRTRPISSSRTSTQAT